MFVYREFYNAGKLVLLTLLLAQPVFVQAQASENVAGDTAVKQDASSERPQRSYYLPRWPERHKQQNDVLPPPPPGPYMSTALTGSPAKWSSSAPGSSTVRMEPPSLPMQAFSPDTPWPSNSTSPDRWKPANGYSYVKPPVKSFHRASPRSMPTNYSYRAPTMNWPGNWSGFNSNAMPLRGPSTRVYPGGRDGSVRTQATRPGVSRSNAYAPMGRPQNRDYGRHRPPVNNAALPRRQPANRAPYPVSGQP